MIQEVRKSIHFTPYESKVGRKKDESDAPTVTLDVKKGKLVFSGKTLEKLHMVDKFVAFYYEPTRKIIGWRVTDKLEPGATVGRSSKWKFVKPFGTGKGFWMGSVTGILPHFKGLLSTRYKDLEVKKYIESVSMLDKGMVYYFVEVREKTDKLGNEIPEE